MRETGTFPISFTRTIEALIVYCMDKVLKHDKEKTLLSKKDKNGMCVLLSRIFSYTGFTST